MNDQTKDAKTIDNRLITADRSGLFDLETEAERSLRLGFYRVSTIGFFFLLGTVLTVYFVSKLSVIAAWFLWNVAFFTYFSVYFRWNRRMRTSYPDRWISSARGWKQTPILSDGLFIFYAVVMIAFTNFAFVFIQITKL